MVILQIREICGGNIANKRDVGGNVANKRDLSQCISDFHYKKTSTNAPYI